MQARQIPHPKQTPMSQDSPASSPFAPPFFTARLTPSGLQVDAWADQPLLHSLEQGGVDWPSSCRNGTCRTCIGQLVSGSVRYEIEWRSEEHTSELQSPC